jgi:hypothetical protein
MVEPERASLQEFIMIGHMFRTPYLALAIVASSLALAAPARSQEAAAPARSFSPDAGAQPAVDVRALTEAIRELQSQVQILHLQLSDLRSEQELARAEAHELRMELSLTRAQFVPGSGGGFQPIVSSSSLHAPLWPAAGSATEPAPVAPAAVTAAAGPQQPTDDRIGRLEENQQLADAKLNDQYQTKVESGSKYRLRLSGIVLLNMYANRGAGVDNQDFPALALEPQPLDSAGSFGGSLRQSQIGMQVVGPDIAGAHTSADVNFDFAGGFPGTSYGVSNGLVRLRTGTVRFDWGNTSIVAGQDHLFFAPLAPTSLASLAIPALAYAGNLWSWTPQVRIEHRVVLSDASSLSFQGGILDSFTGEAPDDYYRSATAGEKSGQPAYASRIAWTHRFFGQNMTAGFGGYYARQNWGFNRNVDGWTGTTDLTLPLSHFFEWTGEFYRGRAVGGIGGGIDQSIVLTGPLTAPATRLLGLNSMGGWTQLKFKPKPKFEVNGAFGQDNPFASQIDLFSANPSYYDSFFARNRSSFVNFIYQPRSDVLFSIEYRRIRTFIFGGDSLDANHVNFSVGYLF